MLIVRYPAEKPINDALSAHAVVRVIWGGDDTVREVRASPLPPHASELTFPRKVSAAVIAAAARPYTHPPHPTNTAGKTHALSVSRIKQY